jgi:hypothetical protein
MKKGFGKMPGLTDLVLALLHAVAAPHAAAIVVVADATVADPRPGTTATVTFSHITV